MNDLEKNLLDLQHSLFSVKGSIFFGIGIGGSLTLFFGLNQIIKERYISILISLIWVIIFGWITVLQFVKCNQIQEKVKKTISF